MNVLIDTQALIWFGANSKKLTREARTCLENADNQVYFSVASMWEIVIKNQLGKLQLSAKPDARLRSNLLDQGMMEVDIKFNHVLFTGNLPFIHRDPFDRVLIAQAIVEGMSIVSSDSKFDAYPVHRIW